LYKIYKVEAMAPVKETLSDGISAIRPRRWLLYRYDEGQVSGVLRQNVHIVPVKTLLSIAWSSTIGPANLTKIEILT